MMKKVKFFLLPVFLLLTGFGNSAVTIAVSELMYAKPHLSPQVYFRPRLAAAQSGGVDDNKNAENYKEIDENIYKEVLLAESSITSVTISAAGDFTLGRDEEYGYVSSFHDFFERENKDYAYFLRNVKDTFTSGDFTIGNLEGPLTDAEIKADKEYRFKGLPEFAYILAEGGVDAVTLANNHTGDYLRQGYEDTVKALDAAGIAYFGNEYTLLTEVKGISIGVLGYTGWSYSPYIANRIAGDINRLREIGAALVIIYFHWGSEYEFYPNQTQINLAHSAIDSGADLILGSHPHVVQGIEKYNGKYIVYSMGNFCYGGHKNPPDKDTFIFQQTFLFEDGELITGGGVKIIPCSISSVSVRNNYQPTPAEGGEYDRIMGRLIEYSMPLNADDLKVYEYEKNKKDVM